MAIFDINIGADDINEVHEIGEPVVAGDLLYLGTDSKYYLADASLKATSTTELKMALINGVTDDLIDMLAYGYYETFPSTLIAGTKYYVSITPGQITSTLYVASNNVTRYIGTAHDTTTLLFNPDQTFVSDSGYRVNDVPLQAPLLPHTHSESEITDLDKYTQAEADALIEVKDGYDTGLIAFGELSINGGDNTKFDIAAGYGAHNLWDVNNPLIDPSIKLVTFGPEVALTPTYLLTSPVSYIGIDFDNDTEVVTVVQQTSPFTNTQRRDIIQLGALVHTANVTVEGTNNIAAPIPGVTNQVHDFIQAVGPLNTSGNVYSANGANLNIDKTAGTLFKLGINYFANYQDPHNANIAAGLGITFRYRLQDSTEYSDITNIDPDNYDLAGVLTTVPPVKFTIQHIDMFQTGITRIQYGQTLYNSKAEAVSALETEPFTTEVNIAENGVFRAYLVVGEGATDLSDLGQAEFFSVAKFGNVTGGSSAITFAAIIAALGYTPEDVANKATDFLTLNDTLYPTTSAVNTLVDANKDAYFTFNQAGASASWVIAHSLGKKPSVTVIDTGGNTVEGGITYTDDNNLTLDFNTAFAGDAYLS